MTVPAEVEVEIRRLHYAEHWPVGTIATQLGVHADVVRRVLGLNGKSQPLAAPRPRLVEPFTDFIAETLRRYPRLLVPRLYDMLGQRGYTGSVRTLREYVATVRPLPKREAFLRLDPLIGEQAQVDWAHVGQVEVPGGTRALWLFVMVLAWSRALWAEFVFDLSVYSLLRSLVRAVTYFGGCTRQWLFDNPKTVVLERHGDAVRFHPLLLELSGLYQVALRLCTVRKANEKGRVERAIRFIRERFLAGREVTSIDQGNRELLDFLAEVALPRPHPTLSGRTVADCLAEETKRLLPLVSPAPATDLVQPIGIDKTAFARFDANLYSVLPEYAEGTLTLVADDLVVRFLDGDREVARHARCWGRKQVIEDAAHREAIVHEKRRARETKGRDRLRTAVPGIDALIGRWVEAGRNVGSMTAVTLKLLDLYGGDVLASAVAEVLARGTHDPGALAVLCDQRRRAADKPVPLDVPLGRHVPDRDVIPHPLENYDVPKRRD
jgi:transposase